MDRSIYRLLGDIRGEIYRNFLRFSATYCEKFLLVVRSTLDINENGALLLKSLSPFEVSSDKRSTWPGTELLMEVAMVREYQLTGSSLELICSLSDSLYDWKQPERPEDLALLRVDDSVFMGSISHEKDAFVSLSDDELRLLREKIPDLQIAL